MLSGSHRGDKNLTFVNEPHKDNLLIRGQTIQNVDLAKTVPMILQAGEFSLHHEAIVHGSDPNNSEHRRIGLSLHYISPDVKRVGYNKNGGRPTASLVRGDSVGFMAVARRLRWFAELTNTIIGAMPPNLSVNLTPSCWPRWTGHGLNFSNAAAKVNFPISLLELDTDAAGGFASLL